MWNLLKHLFISCRDYVSGGSPSEGGEGGAQPELTPQQQHQQYLGDSRPELPPFPEIQWAGNPIPGKETEYSQLWSCSTVRGVG